MKQQIDYILILLVSILLLTTGMIIGKQYRIIKVDTEISTDKKDDNKKNIEGFIVADAQDFEDYYKWRRKTTSLSDSFIESDAKAPHPDRIVDYDDNVHAGDDFHVMVVNGEPKVDRSKEKRKYITRSDFGFNGFREHVSCANASINEQYQFGNKSLLPSQLPCDQPNKLTAENYYKTQYKPIAIPMEDTAIRGSNVEDYINFISPEEVRGLRILSRNTKGLPGSEEGGEGKGGGNIVGNDNGFAFGHQDGLSARKRRGIPTAFNAFSHNSPALPMP